MMHSSSLQRIPLTLDKGTGFWSLKRELPVSFLSEVENSLVSAFCFCFYHVLTMAIISERRKDSLNINIS